MRCSGFPGKFKCWKFSISYTISTYKLYSPYHACFLNSTHNLLWDGALGRLSFLKLSIVFHLSYASKYITKTHPPSISVWTLSHDTYVLFTYVWMHFPSSSTHKNDVCVCVCVCVKGGSREGSRNNVNWLRQSNTKMIALFLCWYFVPGTFRLIIISYSFIRSQKTLRCSKQHFFPPFSFFKLRHRLERLVERWHISRPLKSKRKIHIKRWIDSKINADDIDVWRR